jgi:class 3 adenylate cyclase
VELGWSPEPFLAQLYLDEGEVEAAYRSLEVALGDGAIFAVELRPHLLPTMVTVALAAGRVDEAAATLAELVAVAESLSTGAFQAAAAHGSGQLELARGNAALAADHLRRAHRVWCEVDAPYEAAHVQLAAADAARVRRLVTPASERLERAFMFTDIVDSTRLLDAVGDETWSVLLAWHDRTLRAAFAEHSGEEVKHEGDGFFVAFAKSGDAMQCACAIQRSLDRHRHEHGFAPRVRIGIHTDTATRLDNDYQGRGVHMTARVAALAGAGEILATRRALTAAGTSAADLRTVSLKGFAEPVEVGAIDWRATP